MQGFAFAPVIIINSMKDFSSLEIRKDTVIEDEKIILTYQDTLLMSSNNFSIINGEKGSMKSTLKDLLIEQLISPTGDFTSNLEGNVVVIDTEQSKRIIQNNLDRFSDDSRVNFYSVKGLSVQEMRSKTECIIEELRPEVIVLDSSRDFVMNSNDPEQSMKLINQMLYWAHNYKCHILHIVHSVRVDGGGNKTRGTFGGELDFKAESVLNVERKYDKAFVKSIHNREGLGIKGFRITLDENNKPVIL